MLNLGHDWIIWIARCVLYVRQNISYVWGQLLPWGKLESPWECCRLWRRVLQLLELGVDLWLKDWSTNSWCTLVLNCLRMTVIVVKEFFTTRYL